MLRSQLVGLALVASSSVRLGVATWVRAISPLAMTCGQKDNASASDSSATVFMFSVTISLPRLTLIAFRLNSQLI
jgi:hypothetical protein